VQRPCMKSYTFQLGPMNKALVLLFTLVACIALVFYAEFIARTAVVYTHLFYIPLLLAGVWYHKKAVYVALGLGAVYILITLISPLPLTINEGARAAIFLVVAYVVGFVSEKMEEERRLRESAEKTARIVDSSPIPTFVMDRTHKITHWNTAIEALTGINREEVMGTDKQWTPFYPEKRPVMADFIVDERPERELEELYGDNYRHSPLITSGYEALAFFPSLGEHGKWLRFTAAPLKGPGGDIVGAIETLLDITERKQAEEALKKAYGEMEQRVADRTRDLTEANLKLKELDRLKSMFIASMSHELRTPLNSIIGFTGIILMGMAGELTEEQRKQLTMVKTNANQLLALINDVIDVSKIEAGSVELLIEEFDLTNLVQGVKDSFSLALQDKGLEMTLTMPDTLLIRSDERRTKQIIINLVSNAVKFTDKGVIGLKVVNNGRMVEVSVEDTGIGIKEEDISRLFLAFSRIHVDGVPIREGTGLGLYLSKKIATLLGGELTAKSEFGRGSTFTFTVPLNYEEVKT
jgi:signal transduction histidine kinase